MKEVENFSVLRKGDRVRKYNREDGSFKDGTVDKGTIFGLAYVKWNDDADHIDMSVNLYDVVKLKENK